MTLHRLPGSKGRLRGRGRGHPALGLRDGWLSVGGLLQGSRNFHHLRKLASRDGGRVIRVPLRAVIGP